MEEIDLILGNSNPRFSGVTSTMLQTLRYQREMMGVAVMGRHHLPEGTRAIGFIEAARLCRETLPGGRCRVFHARRNNEVLQALALRRLFGARLRIAFTATAQRHPSWITRWLVREADLVITTSSAANRYIEGGADVVIPHGIDLERYRPAEDKAAAWKALGLPGDRGIGIFGRVRPQKGVDVFVDALIPTLGRYSGLTAVVCGETRPEHRRFQEGLEERIRGAGLSERFLFLGPQPFAELPKLFRGMSVVAALSRNEGFGLTVLEAMASGAAVLASEAGAWRDVVRDGVDGFVVPCGDAEAAAARLEEMLSRPGTVEAMGIEGRRRVESDYTLEREARALCSAFRQLQEER